MYQKKMKARGSAQPSEHVVMKPANTSSIGQSWIELDLIAGAYDERIVSSRVRSLTAAVMEPRT